MHSFVLVGMIQCLLTMMQVIGKCEIVVHK